MVQPTFKSALLYYEQRASLTEADREHLKRLRAEAKNPMWEKIGAESPDELVMLVEGPYSYFIGSALRARREAASLKDTSSLQRRGTAQQEHRKRADLLRTLARKIDEVVRLIKLDRSDREAPDPFGRLSVWQCEQMNSLDWLERKSQRLRDVADEPWRDFDPYGVNVSRQCRGMKKGSRSRELGVFMQIMVSRMKEGCGKPRYDVVAAMTNIAYPGEYVDLEDVRSACRPTTRAARGRRTGTLSR